MATASSTTLSNNVLLDMMLVPRRLSVMIDKVYLNGMRVSDIVARSPKGIILEQEEEEDEDDPEDNHIRVVPMFTPTPVGYWLVYDIPLTALTSPGNLSRVSRQNPMNVHLIGALMMLFSILDEPEWSYPTLPEPPPGPVCREPKKAEKERKYWKWYDEFNSKLFLMKDAQERVRTKEKYIVFLQHLRRKKETSTEKTCYVGYRFHVYIQDPRFNFAAGIEHRIQQNRKRHRAPPPPSHFKPDAAVSTPQGVASSNIWEYPKLVTSRQQWMTQVCSAINPKIPHLMELGDTPLNGRSPASAESDDSSKGIGDLPKDSEATETPPHASYGMAVRYGPMHPGSPYALFDPYFAIETRAKHIMPDIDPDDARVDACKIIDPLTNQVRYAFEQQETVFKFNMAELNPHALCLLRLPLPLSEREQTEWNTKYEGVDITDDEIMEQNHRQSVLSMKLQDSVNALKAGTTPLVHDQSKFVDILDELQPIRTRSVAERAELKTPEAVQEWLRTSQIPELVLRSMCDSVIHSKQAYYEFLTQADDRPYKHRVQTFLDKELSLFGNLC